MSPLILVCILAVLIVSRACIESSDYTTIGCSDVVGAATLVKADICSFVLTKDCAFVPDQTQVCGTDGKTYRNSCFLAKAYCVDPTIHKLNDGPCVGTTTTPAPTTTLGPVDGSLVALDIFCLDLIYINCPTTGPAIFGSDGIFYTNVCEFDKARCFHRDLTNGNNF